MEAPQFRTRQIRWVLLLRVILYSLLLGTSSLLQARLHELNLPPFSQILGFIIFIFVFSITSEFVLRMLQKIECFVYLQILADSIFITLIINATGGALSIFSILYFFPVLSAGVILHTKGGMALASVNTIFFSMVLLAGHSPYIHKVGAPYIPNAAVSLNVTLQALSVYGLSFFLAALLSSVLSERFSTTRAKLTSTTQDLNSLNRLYKQIFDDISSGIITVDTDGTITSFNRASEEITGFSQRQVASAYIADLFPQLKASGDQKERHITEIFRRNREKIPVAYSWARLNLPGDSRESRVYTIQDLSKIKAMEAKVQQAEKMAAIGEIAAGIAHEFRNPLAAISGATQILSKEPGQAETTVSLLRIIQRECDRLGDNINDFLQFSKPGIPEKKWFAMTPVVEESIAIIKRIPGFNPDCQISYYIRKNLDCWADQHQLKQILINLIHNASQAVPAKDGRIIIRCTETTPGSGKEYLRIEVNDNGSGIEPTIVARIFEPFFTTKENGTGLGLAIVKQIVNRHDGTIDIMSTPDTGTSFIIMFPLP